MKGESDQQFTQELNDKLNELWTGAAEKRRELVRNKTPGYSRRSQSSELNNSQTNVSGLVEKQVLKLRDKLQQEVSVGKHKDIEIQHLKKVVSQLSNEKKYLLGELQHQTQPHIDQNYPHALNQSSIPDISMKKSQKKRDNSQNKKERATNNKTKFGSTIAQQQSIKNQKLEDLSKQRLIQLLRSTSEYRSFVFYYDSHELSYLKRLNTQHKKNCTQSASEKEKAYWAPTEILAQLNDLNEQERFGLSQLQQQTIVSSLKGYYERNEQQRLRKMKSSYQQKLKKAVRQNQNSVPYDLVQICKAKQRQLAKLGRKRNITLLK